MLTRRRAVPVPLHPLPSGVTPRLAAASTLLFGLFTSACSAPDTDAVETDSPLEDDHVAFMSPGLCVEPIFDGTTVLARTCPASFPDMGDPAGERVIAIDLTKGELRDLHVPNAASVTALSLGNGDYLARTNTGKIYAGRLTDPAPQAFDALTAERAGAGKIVLARVNESGLAEVVAVDVSTRAETLLASTSCSPYPFAQGTGSALRLHAANDGVTFFCTDKAWKVNALAVGYDGSRFELVPTFKAFLPDKLPVIHASSFKTPFVSPKGSGETKSLHSIDFAAGTERVVSMYSSSVDAEGIFYVPDSQRDEIHRLRFDAPLGNDSIVARLPKPLDTIPCDYVDGRMLVGTTGDWALTCDRSLVHLDGSTNSTQLADRSMFWRADGTDFASIPDLRSAWGAKPGVFVNLATGNVESLSGPDVGEGVYDASGAHRFAPKVYQTSGLTKLRYSIETLATGETRDSEEVSIGGARGGTFRAVPGIPGVLHFLNGPVVLSANLVKSYPSWRLVHVRP